MNETKKIIAIKNLNLGQLCLTHLCCKVNFIFSLSLRGT